MYRVSTAQLAQNGMNAINQNQSKINDLISQISSGVRNDLDPVEKAQQISYSVRISNTAQNIRNGETVMPELTQQERALSAISEKLIQLQETMTGAQNPATYDKNATKEIVSTIKDEILSIVNSQDSQGDYLFSGYKSKTKSFGDLATYNGDQGVRQIRISDSALVDVNITGQKVITKNLTDAFSKIENYVNNGVNDKTMLDSVQKAIGDVSLQQTIVGSNINKINNFKTLNNEFQLQDKSRLSQIQDADLTSLISQLSQAKTASEASLKSYSIIQNLSLFNYI